MKNKHVFTEKNLPQKSKIWTDFRKNGIGASEISILIGTFPKFWSSDFDLFLCKMGKESDYTNQYMEVGNKYEDKARKLTENYIKNYQNAEEDLPFLRNVYDRTSGITVDKPNFKQYTIEHKELNYIFSSYDGLCVKNKLVLEIKCPSEKVFTKFLKNRIPTVPKMYFPQVQAQLWIANSHWNITKGLFAIYYDQGVYFENKLTKETDLIKLILIETELDKEYCQELEMICAKYYKLIEKREWNPNWKD